MSLIGEALKKARAERGGENLPPNVYAAPVRSRSALPWIVAAVSLSLAVGVIVGAGIFYRSTGGAGAGATESGQVTSVSPEAREAVTEPQVSTPSGSADGLTTVTGAAVSEVGREEGESAGVPPSVPGPAPERFLPTPPESEAPTVDSSEVGREPDPAATTPPPRSVEGAEPSGRPRGPRDGDSLLGEVTLADGETIRLQGIVWSDAHPAALIGSEVYAAGEGRGSWRVVSLERDRVELEADGIRFHLRLK